MCSSTNMGSISVREKLVVEYDEEGNLLDDSSDDDEQEANEVNIVYRVWVVSSVRHN